MACAALGDVCDITCYAHDITHTRPVPPQSWRQPTATAAWDVVMGDSQVTGMTGYMAGGLHSGPMVGHSSVGLLHSLSISEEVRGLQNKFTASDHLVEDRRTPENHNVCQSKYLV